MSRRKADEASGQLATKRTCSSIPAFRAVRTRMPTGPTTNTTTGNRTSRVTVIRKSIRGRRGYVTDDRVHPESPDDTPHTSTQVIQEPAADDFFPDSPLPSPSLLDDMNDLTDDLDYEQSTSKPKKAPKKNNLVSLPLSPLGFVNCNRKNKGATYRMA